ncbi:CRISPR-associated endonuclease Cas2, partial [Clostridium perfringens]
MFVILTYDVGEKRVNRVRKILKKYLIWTQNSVFEGKITEAKLHKCLSEINKDFIKD